MDLYYKTLKDSDTGKKFTEIDKRGDACHEALKAFLDKYGFQNIDQAVFLMLEVSHHVQTH
jgi:hypothetical protein